MPHDSHAALMLLLLKKISCFEFSSLTQSGVDIKTVLSQLMERLSNYAASCSDSLPEFLQVEAFSKLNNAIGKVCLS